MFDDRASKFIDGPSTFERGRSAVQVLGSMSHERRSIDFVGAEEFDDGASSFNDEPSPFERGRSNVQVLGSMSHEGRSIDFVGTSVK